MADIKTIISQSSGSISGAVTLEYILASSAPYNYSDFNWKINSHIYPTSATSDVFPVSGAEFVAPASAFDMILDDEACKGSIHNIVNTSKYERVMAPDFGVNMSRAIFELFDEDIVDFTQIELMKAFNQYDPRLQISKVQIVKDAGGSVILINCEVGIRGIDRNIPVVFRNRKEIF